MTDPMKLTFNLPSDEEVCHSVKVRGGDQICLWHTKSTAHRLQTAWAQKPALQRTLAYTESLPMACVRKQGLYVCVCV